MQICIYCGSSPGNSPLYAKAAETLARELVRFGHGIVYGGANVGIMKTIADTALQNKGKVVGIIPSSLVDKEVAHRGLTDLHIVGSMHERKQKMFDLSDGFVVLPGGFGTLDEMFEMITWKQLGDHSKPIILVNVNGYYDHLIKFVDQATDAGFINVKYVKSVDQQFFIAASTPEEAVTRLNSF